ncbi:hypothetical protein [Natrinema pallidum]|uniref:Uncharacterized protein n=1 Tax=Natrinema pallidum DSM 3751 TaxID=1227495 RepID=L9YHM8_9EURY|nr:hypothetical protein [Natrinema pallidum]ELY73206.1 hypothetical protein C487_17430 [Natrinema pallidum DSM 3751]
MIRDFDPSETGPIDLADQTIDAVRQRPVWQPILAFALAAGIWFYFDLSVPVELWILLFSAIGGVAVAAFPIKKVIDWLRTDDDEILEAVDPRDGQKQIKALSPDRFANLVVIDQSGRVRDTDYLYDESINGRQTYECDYYLEESNIAVASWMAGASNSDLRRHKRGVDAIKRRLSIEAERSLDELIEAPEAIRQQGSAAVNRIVQIAEGERSPGDEGSVAETMTDIVENEQDNVDSILEDRTIGDLEDEIKQLRDSTSIEVDDVRDEESSGSSGEAADVDPMSRTIDKHTEDSDE